MRMWLLIDFVVWLLYFISGVSGEMSVAILSLRLLGCPARKAFEHYHHVGLHLVPSLFCSGEHRTVVKANPKEKVF